MIKSRAHMCHLHKWVRGSAGYSSITRYSGGTTVMNTGTSTADVMFQVCNDDVFLPDDMFYDITDRNEANQFSLVHYR